MWAVFFSYKVIMNLACSVNSSEFLFAWVTFSSRWLLAIPMAKTSKIQPRFQSVFSWVKLPCLNCQRCSKRSFSQSLNTSLCKSVLHHLKVSDQDPSYTMRIGGGTPPQLWLMPYNLVEWGEDWEVGQVEMPHSHKLEEVGNCLETFSLITSFLSVYKNGQHAAFTAVKQLSTASNPIGDILFFKRSPEKIFQLKIQKFIGAKSLSKFWDYWRSQGLGCGVKVCSGVIPMSVPHANHPEIYNKGMEDIETSDFHRPSWIDCQGLFVARGRI